MLLSFENSDRTSKNSNRSELGSYVGSVTLNLKQTCELDFKENYIGLIKYRI